MQNKLDKLIGKCFLFEGKQFKVLSANAMSSKAVIKTDKRTFVFYETELDDFLEAIDIREISSFEEKADLIAHKSNDVHDVEIIRAENVAVKMVDKLMDVFDALSDSPTEETYKKAKAMVDVSGAVVNAQVLQLRLKMARR